MGFLLAAQAVVVLLAGLNLAWGGTRTPLPVGEFVRWREIFSLGFATPASVVLQFLALWTLERGRRDATGPLTLFAVLPLNVTLELAYALSLVALVWAKM